MNKRIASILLCFVMVFTMFATAVPALAALPTPFYIDPDKTEAHPGDTITYTVKMGSIEGMGGLLLEMNIPEGLEYISGSGKDAEGIATTLNAIIATYTDSTHIFNVGMSNYTGSGEIALFSFQCKVKDGVSGNISVTFADIEVIDGDEEDIPYDISNLRSTVNVTAAPKPATGISLNKSTLELTVGESETLVATVEPADTTDTVTWDTGRSDIATVDSTGKITAVAPGTAVIAARAGEKSAFCTVTVVAAPCTHTNKTNVDAKTSTCKEQGWEAYSKCNDCGQLFDKDGNEISEIPYLSLADHKYTANEKKPEALKTAGTCKDKAIYLRSCEVCGKVAPSEAWGTFYGDTDPNNHAGGTTTVNASEPDHKNQVDGYTGDTKCLGCKEIIAYGTSIPAGAHTPSSTWNSNETHHWKECTTMGCGVVIDGSKAEHSSTGANVATCQHKAVCDVCNVEYGALASHNPASGWTSDASGHWHACQTANCTEKCDFAAHTPDHTGHATEEYAIKCTECDYVIEAQLGHTHVFDKEVATDAYKASDATCTAKATYYKSCACGEKGTETFEYGELAEHNWTPATCTAPKTCSVCQATEGEPNGHTEGTDWKNDANYHWHICSVDGCGAVIESSKAAHTPDREAATETEPVKCAVCDYEIAPALGMQDYILEMPVFVSVKLTGDEKPGKETFKLEIYDCGVEDAEFEILNDVLTAEDLEFVDGGAYFYGVLKIKVTGQEQLFNLTEGFKVRMVKGTAKGWTYASEQWYVMPIIFEGTTDAAFYFGYDVREIVDGEISEIPANGMSFTLGYEAVTEPATEPEPEPATDPETPKTGDNSMMVLWIALFVVSGAGVTAIYSRKRKSSAK